MRAPPQASEHTPPWQAARRVLAVRLDQIGDVLMTTPALGALRESLPQARITLLTSPSAAALAPHLRDVHDVLPFAAPWMKLTAELHAAPGDAELALVQRLRAERFDAAVVFTVCTQSALPAALLCRMAGIPMRLATVRENPYALLTHWQRERDEPLHQAQHEVQRQLHLVGSVGLATADARLRFHVRDADRTEAAAALAAAWAAEGPTAAALAPGRPYLLVHPGASAPSRRWGPERFGATAAAVAARSGCAVVVCGGADDAPLVQATLAAVAAQGTAPAVSLAGRLSLGGLGAAVEGARLVLANNSAPAHVAAAIGTPVVVLYALTNPQHTPWQVPHRALWHDTACRWCLHSHCPQPRRLCLDGVPVADAVAAALDLMHETAHGQTRVA